jgi:ATP-binding cassette subfamily B multidrug efflux pump
LLGFFEKLLHPFPSNEPLPVPGRFIAFLWACTQGVRGKIAAMAILTMIMSVLEVMLIAMFGRIVDRSRRVSGPKGVRRCYGWSP